MNSDSLHPRRLCSITTFSIISLSLVGIIFFVVVSSRSFAQESVGTEMLVGDRVIDAVNQRDLDSALPLLGDVVDAEWTVAEMHRQRIPAAAAAVYRLLASQSSDQQYESLLRWSLPSEDRLTVRVLSVPVPTRAPPKDFARAIRQRPQDKTFAVANIAGMEGVFCSGWILVEAAEEMGRLSRLISKLQSLQEEGVPGVESLLNLAILKNTRADTGPLKVELDRRASASRPLCTLSDITAVAVACAASTRKELGESAIATLASFDQEPSPVRSFLRTVHALATQEHLGDQPTATLSEQEFQYMQPVTGGAAIHHDQGTPPSMWLTHEDHLLHVAGGTEDTLFFRYPITGEFDFVVETQGGGAVGTDGGLVYGGLHFEAIGRESRLRILDADGRRVEQRFCPFIRHEPTPLFHRLSIRARDEKIALETNFHPMWTFEKASATSPWLGLRSRGHNRPVFRNWKLSGSPTIPRSVVLIADGELRGWYSDFFAQHDEGLGRNQESTNSKLPTSAKVVRENSTADWSVTNGVLNGHANTNNESPSPKWLRYERPLTKGETVTYQFKHADGDATIHPSLGSMVFLIEGGGVRVRWMTNHAKDWTGLTLDHALLEPLSRRGPKPLPLKENEWNEVSLAHTGDFIDLSLNGQLIYHRKLDFQGSTQFGLYRQGDALAEVQSVTLTGDWPDQLPPACLANPFRLPRFDPLQRTQAFASKARVGSKVAFRSAKLAKETHFSPSDRRPLRQNLPAHRSIGESTIQSNAMGFRRTLATLSNRERYDRLVRWVMPKSVNREVASQHQSEFNRKSSTEVPREWISGFRLNGFFKPTRASPHQMADLAFANWGSDSNSSQDDLSPIIRLSEYFSPASDCVHMASKLGKLDDIEKLVNAFHHRDDSCFSWQQSVTLCLIACERHDQTGVEELLDVLSKFKSYTPVIGEQFLIASTVAQTFPDSKVVLDYVTTMQERHALNRDTRVDVVWKTHWMALAARIHRRHLDDSEDSVRRDELPGKMVRSVVSNLKSQGEGRSLASWRCSRRGEIHHVAGHSDDRLYFPSPLRGDYTIEADVVPWSSVVLANLGEIIKPGTKSYGIAKLGAKLQHTLLDPIIVQPSQWMRYRQEVRGQHSTVYFNGRKVYQRQRRDTDDPWFAFQSWWKGTSTFRDFSILGDPVIPEEIDLSTSPELIGWTPYYGVRRSVHLPNWTTESVDQTNLIVGGRANLPAGSTLERLLQYHRPFAEDGAIEYQFFYREGHTTAGPALGRFAMLLEPKGVSQHWITDGRFERTLVRPDQVSRVEEHQQHRGILPLKNNAWNRARLSILGGALTLHLNDELIYQRALSDEEDRTFGLFYFADETGLRVRNVTMRCDWPMKLPSPSPFADPEIASLDQHRDTLPVVFHQELNDPESVAEYFDPPTSWMQGGWQATPQGKKTEVHSEGNWAFVSVSPRFSVQGDFDIEVGFKDLQINGPQPMAGARLSVVLADEFARELMVSLGHMDDERHLLYGGQAIKLPDGTKRYINQRYSDASTSGRMRIVRRDQQASLLFAEGDSPIYRLLAQYQVSTAEVPLSEVNLIVYHSNGVGNTRVVWTDCTIRAESMKR